MARRRPIRAAAGKSAPQPAGRHMDDAPRMRIEDELGRPQTLACGPEAYARLDGPEAGEDGTPRVLLLGLGPEPRTAARLLANASEVLWLECPDFAEAMDAAIPGRRRDIPPAWEEISPSAAARAARGRQVWTWRQGARLFSAFWGPVLGAVRAELLRGGPAPHAERAVILPGDEKHLLHRELAGAFAAAGFAVRQTDGDDPAALRALLRRERPALCFSVNLRGLDANGETFELLRACGVPTALWFADNPWHILSALRLPWWKDARLHVTDASFIEPLRRAGARSVRHLPLAFCPDMARAAPKKTVWTDGSLAFVGRAAFPARQRFFAAARTAATDMEAALALLEAGGEPDFHWWTQRLNASLWPGHGVRGAGLGAEICAALQRARWLRAALEHDPRGLRVFGDRENWEALLPGAPNLIWRDAVDYYGALPSIYAAAPYTLNVSSLLLPAGLTQRHFDVWAAGGFLLSNPTPGLSIFPEELVREMRVDSPAALPAALTRLERDSSLRLHVGLAWRQHVLNAHGYAQRVAAVAEGLAV